MNAPCFLPTGMIFSLGLAGDFCWGKGIFSGKRLHREHLTIFRKPVILNTDSGRASPKLHMKARYWMLHWESGESPEHYQGAVTRSEPQNVTAATGGGKARGAKRRSQNTECNGNLLVWSNNAFLRNAIAVFHLSGDGIRRFLLAITLKLNMRYPLCKACSCQCRALAQLWYRDKLFLYYSSSYSLICVCGGAFFGSAPAAKAVCLGINGS